MVREHRIAGTDPSEGDANALADDEPCALRRAADAAGAPAESQTLPSALVVRASCGCEMPLTTREVVQ